MITVDFKELTIAFGDILTFIGAFFYALHIYFLGKLTKKVDLFALMAFQLLMFSIIAFKINNQTQRGKVLSTNRGSDKNCFKYFLHSFNEVVV